MVRLHELILRTRLAAGRVRVIRRRLPIAPIVILGGGVIAAVFADVLVPHSPVDISLGNRLLPPFWMEGGSLSHLLGTDPLGRDILSRITHGTRVTLVVTLGGVLPASLIGTALGLVAGYIGGLVDTLIMRACDVMLSFPTVLIGLLFAVAWGPSLQNVILVVILIIWARYARVVRGEVLSWKQRVFVSYAKVAGTSPPKIMVQHLFPNVLNTTLVLLSFNAAFAIILESILSFLGAGVPPPTPSWGGMVSEGREYLATAWWAATLPGVAIVLMVLALNMLGDWLRDALDPKLRQI
jgi:peptide/nickel transport system permease protein